MKAETSIDELLQWRLLQAGADAPPAPSAARLLALSRPWWELWPEHFQKLAERLSTMTLNYGHASMQGDATGGGIPVPTLIVQARKHSEIESLANILYFNLKGARLRLRFQLDTAPGSGEEAENIEVTFLSDANSLPLFDAVATLAAGNEYRLDAELPPLVQLDWAKLKVTDRMPFRLIIKVGKTHS